MVWLQASYTPVLDARGLTVSSLAFYPNNLHPDPEQRQAANDHLRKVIVAAQKLGVEVVGTFVGRDATRSIPQNLETFREVWPPLVQLV